MKNMKKIFALVLALMMVLGMTSAFAVTITVNRDSTYQTGADGDRDYTWYRVFTVVKDGNYTATGGGYDADGTPGNVTTGTGSTATAFAYTASLTVANKLGTYTAATNTWAPASGQNWFTLTPIAGTDPQTFSVAWVNASETTDTAQDAARWMFDHQVWDANGNLAGVAGTVDSADNFTQWQATGLTEGYYLLKGTEGQNLIAATTDININEKNSYPTIDKKETDTANGTYGDGPVKVKIGDHIYYQVEVKVPADANADIVVTDTMATGLTYDSNIAVTVGDTVDAAAAISNESNANYEAATKGGSDTWTWQYTIHPTAATKGKYVVFTFSGTVNADALVSTDRKNDVELDYNNGHYVVPDTVDYDIGALAIVKYDGATAELDQTTNVLGKKASANAIKYLEASFALKDANGAAINVSPKTSGVKGVYVVDSSSNSNIVTSDKTHDGVILIYGLDPEVTYTLTETATEEGYNLLDTAVTPTSVEATKADANTTKVTVRGITGIFAGNENADAANTLELVPTQVAKVENLTGTVLPSTGGMGTTILYIGGSILVILAAVLLITKRRMNAED